MVKTDEATTPAATVETKEVVEAPEPIEVDSTDNVTATATTTKKEDAPVVKEKVTEKAVDEPMVDIVEEVGAAAATKTETPVVVEESAKTEEKAAIEAVEPEKKNGHTNGEANGHVENGSDATTEEPEKTAVATEKIVETEKVAEEKIDESPEEIKAKKLAEAEPTPPPTEIVEA